MLLFSIKLVIFTINSVWLYKLIYFTIMLAHGRPSTRVPSGQLILGPGPNRPPPFHLQYDAVSSKNKNTATFSFLAIARM
jgi:hypothetical protein